MCKLYTYFSHRHEHNNDFPHVYIMYHLQKVKCICVDERIIYSLCAYYGQACALKIASECTRNAPLTLDQVFFWSLAQLFSGTVKKHQGLFAPTHASF